MNSISSCTIEVKYQPHRWFDNNVEFQSMAPIATTMRMHLIWNAYRSFNKPNDIMLYGIWTRIRFHFNRNFWCAVSMSGFTLTVRAIMHGGKCYGSSCEYLLNPVSEHDINPASAHWRVTVLFTTYDLKTAMWRWDLRITKIDEVHQVSCIDITQWLHHYSWCLWR